MQPTRATDAAVGGCDAEALFRAGRYESLVAIGADRGSAGLFTARALALLDRLAEATSLLDRIAALGGAEAVDAAVEREDVALRGYAPADGVLARLDALPTLPADGAAHGRRLVMRATALARLHRLEEATVTTLEAVEIFTALGKVDERARALYAAGKILAWSGDLEQAGLRLALALADWASVGNMPETAVTIVGLGRLNLAARRFAHALDFLHRGRDLSPRPENSRVGIRVRHGIARALCGLERSLESRGILLAAAADARAAGISYLEFICVRDAAIAAARDGDAAQATTLLEQAAAIIAGQAPESFDSVSLLLARGAVASALDQPDAVTILEAAARAVAGRHLRAFEIDNLRLLAKALIRGGRVREAERHLTAAYRIATGKGLSWHRREIRMDLARLRVAEGTLVETDRQIHHVDSSLQAEGLPERGYLVRARLGGGTFGEVFRAYDLDNAREVAIKRLSFTGLYDVDRAATIIASVERELDAATRVEHPGVARVYGLNRSGGGDFHLVQEFVEGPSLRRWMAEHPRPDPHVVAAIALRIAQPLSAIHRAGVIHRDLKPENVMLRNGEDPVIIDFGIAHVDRPGAAPPPGLGTPAYMPPEQAAGRRLDARCDVFALGTIILEWLGGLSAGDPAALPLRRVAERMARKRRWQRPATMDVVIDMIREAVESG